jgi:esterase
LILHSVEAGQGAPVVLLHGLFGAARNLGEVQRRLVREGFRAVSLDLRNHGASGHAAEMGYAAMARDVADTLAALGVGRAAVLGHSMGGKVAMALALAQPERVERLVVADIAPLGYPPHFRSYAAAMLAVPEAASRAEADALLAPVVADAAARMFLLQNRVPGGWRIGLAEIAAALPAIEGWEPGPCAGYGGKVLAVVGGRSDYVGPDGRAAFARTFADVRFVVLGGAGHWLHAEDPAGFGDAVTGFLAEPPAAG